MYIPKPIFKTVALAAVVLMLGASLLMASTHPAWGRVPAEQLIGPNPATPTPTMVATSEINLPPPPSRISGGVQAQVAPAALSSTLSYYFVSGAEFVPYGQSTTFFHQVTGCVNQVPVGHPFTAGVHLPQGSQVRTITLYTYNDTITSTVLSTAYFIISDAKGVSAYTVSASANHSTGPEYQQATSPDNNPWTIDNQNYAHHVEWRLNAPSTLHSLCGIRIAYYAPLFPAAYLPHISK